MTAAADLLPGDWVLRLSHPLSPPWLGHVAYRLADGDVCVQWSAPHRGIVERCSPQTLVRLDPRLIPEAARPAARHTFRVRGVGGFPPEVPASASTAVYLRSLYREMRLGDVPRPRARSAVAAACGALHIEALS